MGKGWVLRNRFSTEARISFSSFLVVKIECGTKMYEVIVNIHINMLSTHTV